MDRTDIDRLPHRIAIARTQARLEHSQRVLNAAYARLCQMRRREVPACGPAIPDPEPAGTGDLRETQTGR